VVVGGGYTQTPPAIAWWGKKTTRHPHSLKATGYSYLHCNNRRTSIQPWCVRTLTTSIKFFRMILKIMFLSWERDHVCTMKTSQTRRSSGIILRPVLRTSLLEIPGGDTEMLRAFSGVPLSLHSCGYRAFTFASCATVWRDNHDSLLHTNL
jgi:hypothetical protein